MMKVNDIYTGNCTDLMKSMDSESVDLILTSPPYDDMRTYNGYNFDFESIAQEMFRIIKKHRVVVWVVGDKIKNGRTLTSFRQGLYFQEIGFQMHDVMIFKKYAAPFPRSNAYRNEYEFMFILSKYTPKVFNPIKEQKILPKYRKGYSYNKRADGTEKTIIKDTPDPHFKIKSNIWEYKIGSHSMASNAIAYEHPAIFPEALAADHIKTWTNEGDLVLDPMCGSGTTCAMAMRFNRKYIGFDISEQYAEIARKRIDLTKDIFSHIDINGGCQHD